MKKHGFTLAEVLVTLGIIGVVSAMTIPALTQNWQKRAYVTQLHKVYNVLQQAMTEEMNNKEALNATEVFVGKGSTSGADAHEKQFLHDHFKVIKDCGANYTQCFASTYRTINGTSVSINNLIYGYAVVIAGGAAISLNIGANNDYAGYYIYVDTNGQKGPNILGRDMFEMSYMNDGSIDAYGVGKNSSPATRQNYRNNAVAYCQQSGWGCFAKILNDNWEMNY